MFFKNVPIESIKQLNAKVYFLTDCYLLHLLYNFFDKNVFSKMYMLICSSVKEVISSIKSDLLQ